MVEFKLALSSLGYCISELTKILQSSNKVYRLTIKEWKESRSLSQNALFHMWVNELSKFLIKGGRKDSSPEFCKELLKHTFLGYEQIERVNAKTGERVVVSQLRHTSKLNLGEMTHFMDKCNAWCVDIGLLLTIPVDSEYYKLMEQQND